MRPLLGLVLISSLIIFGCTTNFQSGINCQMDNQCFTQAIMNDCQDAYLSYSGGGYYPGASMSVLATKKEGYCEITTRNLQNGQQVEGYVHKLAIPLRQCGIIGSFFVDARGQCVSWGAGYNADYHINP